MTSVDHPTTFVEAFNRWATQVSSVIQGKDGAIREALICFLCGGHLLIEDVPGMGKTTLARAIAASAQVDWGRVQFTPDLLPSDVTGVSIWNQKTSEFEFRPGPGFPNSVLAAAHAGSRALVLELFDDVVHGVMSPRSFSSTGRAISSVEELLQGAHAEFD